MEAKNKMASNSLRSTCVTPLGSAHPASMYQKRTGYRRTALSVKNTATRGKRTRLLQRRYYADEVGPYS